MNDSLKNFMHQFYRYTSGEISYEEAMSYVPKSNTLRKANTMSVTVEKIIKIYDDTTGELIQIGPDSDGLELVEITYRDSDGNPLATITANVKQVVELGKAIRYLYGD